jgi:uncharacterized coiled-coil DUF342 family protein
VNNQSLSSLKSDYSAKTKPVIDELSHLQDLKAEQSKQLMSEIKALTIKRNFLLKQIKELYGVIEQLKYKKDKMTTDIDEFVKNRMQEIKVVDSLKVETKLPIDINPRGIIN